jgi:hypothetical protein
MLDVSDLRSTIIPKSDQLNAEQLLGGPMTIRVSDVRIGSSDEQPISVHYDGENGRPFKPCKTMRKVLIFAWGPDGREWVGKSMKVYNDPQVKFGGAEVGGIRISHMTDIAGVIKVSLTATKGKKALHTIAPLVVEPVGMDPSKIADWVQAISVASLDELDAVKKDALAQAEAAQDRTAFSAFSAAAKKRRASFSASGATA